MPVISLAGGGAIVEPQDGPRRWAFKMSPTETISLNVVFDDMAAHKATTMASIAIATSYGEGFLKAVERVAPTRNIKVVATEKYAPTDQSVTAQVLKVIGANPDAVFIFSAGTPGAPVRPVPVDSRWMLLLMGFLLMLAGAPLARRRR